MASKPSFVRFIALAILAFGISNAVAQDELRNTFFKDVDASLALAEEANAKLLAPNSYGEGLKDYQAADAGLDRGRNIDYVRKKTAAAQVHFDAATQSAGLAKTGKDWRYLVTLKTSGIVNETLHNASYVPNGLRLQTYFIICL